MKIQGQHYQTIWLNPQDSHCVQIIDQRFLPHQFVVEDLRTVKDAADAIREMHVRGAPLIGATAAYGIYLACLENQNTESSGVEWLHEAATLLKATRPTAIDLAWAVDRQLNLLTPLENPKQRTEAALQEAKDICELSVKACYNIGQYGLDLIKQISENKKGEPVNILTHCNAGWLACVDHGTATAPMYAAHDAGIPIHVWVDETRPRNQGARLTAFELLEHGIPHTIIADNVGGHLMQHGMVDMVIVGTDRTTRCGDVANKIGTYLKALAAKDNDVPFYVALPSSTIDWTLRDGIKEIPIEERNASEVKYMQGTAEGKLHKVLITPKDSPAMNFGFDVTPAHLVTALITERGICLANEKELLELFQNQA